MGMFLEIKAGPMAGRKIPCRTGESVLIGRDPARSQFAVANDKHMSGAHFAVECGAQGSRVVDRKSSNGTFLNGKSIKEATLTDGDEIRSGETVFIVHLGPDAQAPVRSSRPATIAVRPFVRPPSLAAPKPAAVPPRPNASAPSPLAHSLNISPTAPAPSPDIAMPPVGPKAPAQVLASSPRAKSQPAAFSIGSWSLCTLPEGWEVQQGFGLQRSAKKESFPSSLVFLEEQLSPRISFASYIESQISMFRQYLRDPKIEPTPSPDIDGTEEKVAFDVRHKTGDNVEIFYRRVYARHRFTVGVLTLTTLDKDSAKILESLDSFWAGLAFRPPSVTPQPFRDL